MLIAHRWPYALQIEKTNVTYSFPAEDDEENNDNGSEHRGEDEEEDDEPVLGGTIHPESDDLSSAADNHGKCMH